MGGSKKSLTHLSCKVERFDFLWWKVNKCQILAGVYYNIMNFLLFLGADPLWNLPPASGFSKVIGYFVKRASDFSLAWLFLIQS